MFKKQEILDSIKNAEDRLLISKVLDQAALSLKYHEVKFTNFLDPYQHKLLTQKLKYIAADIHTDSWGGYQESERKILSFFPKYIEHTDIDYPIVILEVVSNHAAKLTHRDFLGSILGLGIKREKIGDILINENACYIFVMSDISNFIKIHLNKVANTCVSIVEKNVGELIIPQRKYKALHATVASLRIDAVLSAALGESRSKVLPYIHSEKVSINWEPCKSPSQILKEGDIISVRGHGRMVLECIRGTTRKGRISITVKRFI